MKKLVLLLTIFTLLIIGFSVEMQAQCSMCKAVLESNMQSGEDAVGKGINGGIMYIMFIPYILLAVAGFFTYKHYKKTNQV